MDFKLHFSPEPKADRSIFHRMGIQEVGQWNEHSIESPSQFCAYWKSPEQLLLLSIYLNWKYWSPPRQLTRGWASGIVSKYLKIMTLREKLDTWMENDLRENKNWDKICSNLKEMKTYTIQRHIYRFLCHTKTCIWVFMLTSFVKSLKNSL